MEKVLQSLKNLYKGEHVLRKHFMLLLLFIFPALMSGVAGFADKGVPEKIMIAILVIVLFLAILSIVPMFWLLGYTVNFVEDRLMKKVGIPQITFTSLLDGVKVFPFIFVWSIYFSVIFIGLFLIPLIPLFADLSSKTTPGAASIIILICGILLAFLVCIAFTVLVVPFYNYIFIEYIKYGHRGELYNPLYLGRFMKIAFKDTLIVFGKFWLVSLIASFPIGILNMFVVVIGMTVFMGAAMATPGALESNTDAFIYNPFAMFIVVLLSAGVAIIQMYVNTMIANAATENYIDVYNEKIAPLDETQEVIVEDNFNNI